jgi:hypothetical protein
MTALSGQVRACQSLHEVLTVIARASLDARAPATNADHVRHGQLIDAGRTALKGLVSMISAEQLDALARLVEKDEAFAAAALLKAFDDELGRFLALEFQSGGRELVLRKGDPFPIARHHLGDLYGPGGKFTSRPINMQLPWRRMEHLGVWDGFAQWKIVFDFHDDSFLNRLLLNPCIGVLRVNSTEVEFECNRDEKRRVFFGVRPIDQAAQKQAIEAAFGAADRAGAAAILLPELSVTPELAALVGNRVRDARSIRFAVAGSYHAPASPKPDSVEGANLLEIHTDAARKPTCHRKFNPYELGKWREQRYDPPLTEDIVGTPQITVHWSLGYSFVAMICKDFLAPETLQILQILQPNFVFVVSMSDVSAPFEANARDLVQQCQSFVVVANFGEQVALAAAPLAVGSGGGPAVVSLLKGELGEGSAAPIIRLNHRFSWEIPI